MKRMLWSVLVALVVYAVAAEPAATNAPAVPEQFPPLLHRYTVVYPSGKVAVFDLRTEQVEEFVAQCKRQGLAYSGRPAPLPPPEPPPAPKNPAVRM